MKVEEQIQRPRKEKRRLREARQRPLEWREVLEDAPAGRGEETQAFDGRPNFERRERFGEPGSARGGMSKETWI